MAGEHTDRGLTAFGAAALALGGILVAWFSRRPWLEVGYYDDRVGGGARSVPGGQWSTEASAVALLLLIAAVAVLALRRVPRRVIGAIAAIAAAGAALSPLGLLIGGPDEDRVRALLTAGSGDIQSTTQSISAAADLTSIDLNPINVTLAVIGFILAVAGGLAVLIKPGHDSAKLNKYETEAVRMEKIDSDLKESPDSGRVLWDAMDADMDPTDPDTPHKRE